MYRFCFLFVLFASCSHLSENDLAPLAVVPSVAQMEWQQREMIGFIHFTVNTFTDREWGDGTESPTVFNPDSLNVTQWVSTAKAAGMKMLILTAKHHDGFCLWPSAYTEHSVKNSPWKNGKGDIVKELSDACREDGLQFGVYLSPWDRHESSYGTDAYNTYYKNQIRELLTNYGTISEFWMDGAKGENARNMEYDFKGWRDLIHKLQPGCLIFSDAGPDVRWIGNESGIAGETNWSMINRDSIIIGKAPVNLLNTGDPQGKYWVPGECDVSIRPGWFYHSSQDGQVRTALNLVDLFYKSVGRNGVFLLNIPPNRHGLISQNDVDTLKKFRYILDETFKSNLCRDASATGEYRSSMKNFTPDNILDGNDSTYWAPNDGILPDTIEIHFNKNIPFNRVMVQEPVYLGQRISAFAIDILQNDSWHELLQGTTIGYKRILCFPQVTSSQLRIRIMGSLNTPALSEVAVFMSSSEEGR